jgi:hypothetical protein
MKAADIPDHTILQSIKRHTLARSIGANRWEIYGDFKDFPEKVVHAKLHVLLRRGLITGCCCGCRGDFGLTQKGLELHAR